MSEELSPLPVEALVAAIEEARAARARTGFPGAVVVRIDETNGRPLHWSIQIVVTTDHRRKSVSALVSTSTKSTRLSVDLCRTCPGENLGMPDEHRIACRVCRRPVVQVGTEPREDRPGHRLVYRHADGAECRPLSANDRYSIPCSSCGRLLRFTVMASSMLRPSSRIGPHCECGASWRLEQTSRTVGVWIGA
jgi:hypothetical protein